MAEQFLEEIREATGVVPRELLAVRRIPIRAVAIRMEALTVAKTSESAEASACLLRPLLRFKLVGVLPMLANPSIKPLILLNAQTLLCR